MKAVLLWIALILSDTSGQLLLKQGAVQAASAGWMPNTFILSGLLFYLLSFVIWMQMLRDIRLFIALSGSTIVYVTIALGSHVLFGEALTTHVLVGTGLISAGVFLIGWGRSAPALP